MITWSLHGSINDDNRNNNWTCLPGATTRCSLLTGGLWSHCPHRSGSIFCATPYHPPKCRSSLEQGSDTNRGRLALKQLNSTYTFCSADERKGSNSTGAIANPWDTNTNCRCKYLSTALHSCTNLANGFFLDLPCKIR